MVGCRQCSLLFSCDGGCGDGGCDDGGCGDGGCGDGGCGDGGCGDGGCECGLHLMEALLAKLERERERGSGRRREVVNSVAVFEIFINFLNLFLKVIEKIICMK